MKIRNRHTRAVMSSREDVVTANDSLVTNPFVSEAQRRACYAADDPKWDCKEWERHTPKKKLPKRKGMTKNQRKSMLSRLRNKRTTNNAVRKVTPSRKTVNPLRIDPTRTATLRRQFITELRKRFTKLKLRVIDLVDKQDVFGLKERQPLSFNEDYSLNCGGVGSGVPGPCPQNVNGSKLSSISSKLSALANRIPVVGTIKQTVSAGMKAIHTKLESRYGSKVATTIMTSGAIGGYGVAAAAFMLTGVPGIPFVNDIISIAAHTAAAEFGLQVGRLAKRAGVRNERGELVSWEEVENVFCPTGIGGGIDATCSPGQPAKGESGTKDNPICCGDDIKLAAKLLSQGKHIELSQPDQVATLLDRMSKMIDKAIEKGEDAPKFDLCKVSAPNSNLFCQESLGIPRIDMPQMRGIPVPGTYAATKEASKKTGKVDLTKEFLDHLTEEGIKSEQTTIRASHLRASQKEIVGDRVIQLINETRAGTRDLREKPIFVTRDNYIVDGHHHWAAIVGHGYSRDKDMKIPVYKLDMDIGKALSMANEFTKRAGLAPKSGATSNVFCATGEGGGIDPSCSLKETSPAEDKVDASLAKELTKIAIEKTGCGIGEESVQCHAGTSSALESLLGRPDILGAKGRTKVYEWDDSKWTAVRAELSLPEGKWHEGIRNLIEDIKDGTVNGHSFMIVGRHAVDPHLASLNVPKKQIDEIDRYLATIYHKVGITPKIPPSKRVINFDQEMQDLEWEAIDEVTNLVHETASRYHDDLYTSLRRDRDGLLLAMSIEKEYKLETIPTTNTRWQFSSDPEKIKAFQGWLKTQIDQTILAQTEKELWQRFVEAGFKKGTARAFDDTKKSPRWGPHEGDFYKGSKQQFLRDSFRQPVAVEKVQLLASRVFTDLENVTDVMATHMSRSLIDGLVQGKGPREISRDLVENVDDIGITRATAIARTEIVRAHAEGQLEALDQLGVEEVGVQVELSTAGDGKVCEECQALEGTTFTIDEARGVIPLHPS